MEESRKKILKEFPKGISQAIPDGIYEKTWWNSGKKYWRKIRSRTSEISLGTPSKNTSRAPSEMRPGSISVTDFLRELLLRFLQELLPWCIYPILVILFNFIPKNPQMFLMEIPEMLITDFLQFFIPYKITPETKRSVWNSFVSFPWNSKESL